MIPTYNYRCDHFWHLYWPKYRPFVAFVLAKVSAIFGICNGQSIGHVWHLYWPKYRPCLAFVLAKVSAIFVIGIICQRFGITTSLLTVILIAVIFETLDDVCVGTFLFFTLLR